MKTIHLKSRMLRLWMGLVFSIAGSTSIAETVFFDDFDDRSVTNDVPLDRDGNSVVWTPLAGFDSGTFDPSSGDYVLTTNVSASSLVSLTSSGPFGDNSIRSQMQYEGPPAAIALFARVDPIALSAYQGGIVADGNVYIARTDPGAVTETLTAKPAEFDVTSEGGVYVQFDVIGNKLSLFVWPVDGKKRTEPTLEVIDDTFDDGFAGVLLDTYDPGPGSATFHFVHVADSPIPALPCDFNYDTFCDMNDIDRMFAVGDISVGVSVPPADPVIDLRPDELVDALDVSHWLESAALANGFASPYLYGDANLDGVVNTLDLNALALNWKSDDAVWSSGDFTGEGQVDSHDLNAIGTNWQQSIPVASSASAQVPEPSTLLLAGIALTLVWRRRIQLSYAQ